MAQVIEALAAAAATSSSSIRHGHGGAPRMLSAWLGCYEGMRTLRQIAAALRLRSAGSISDLIRRCDLELGRAPLLRRIADGALRILLSDWCQSFSVGLVSELQLFCMALHTQLTRTGSWCRKLVSELQPPEAGVRASTVCTGKLVSALGTGCQSFGTGVASELVSDWCQSFSVGLVSELQLFCMALHTQLTRTGSWCRKLVSELQPPEAGVRASTVCTGSWCQHWELGVRASELVSELQLFCMALHTQLTRTGSWCQSFNNHGKLVSELQLPA